jgi:type VII secretion protein EccE
LALLVIVPAVMAYPWNTPTDWWVLGIAIAVVVLAFARWGGLFLTTMIGRRFAVWRRNHGKSRARASDEVTVLLRVEAPDGATLPLSVLAGYVLRFGIRASKVRATSVDAAGARTTWVAMTLSAADNLAALQARSPEIPLHDTAETVGRRLAGQLREAGLNATIVDVARGSLVARGQETWRAVRDDGEPAGYVAAYRIPVDERLGDRLAEVWSLAARETWTALEFSITAKMPTVAAVCAFRTDDAPVKPPLPGLQAQRGLQRPLLTALDPRSTDRLGVETAASQAATLEHVVHRICWPTGFVNLTTRHAAESSGDSHSGMSIRRT